MKLLFGCPRRVTTPLLLLVYLLILSPAPVLSSSRGVSFLSRNSRSAAKKAYAAHLENELEATRRQLYTSQNTCNTLRKRCDDQRKETLRLMTSAATATTTSAETDREEDKEQLIQQEKEIERLQRKLQQETRRFQEQVEKLTLLEAEMKEIKKMKVQSNNEAEVKEYQGKLEQSQKKQTEYEQEIQLLTLKLEAAQVAAQQQRGGEGDLSITSRAQELQAQLQSVREKYSTILNKAKVGGYDESYQEEIESEMEQSIQMALEVTLKAVEDQWETRYAEVESKLAKMSDHVESLEQERDSALRQLKATVSS